MEIVTGYKGEPHIESDDIQSLLRGLVGSGACVMDTADRLNAELTDANTVTISAGDIVFQGVHARIPYGSTDTVAIANGTSDYDRKDIIALRYERNESTGVESVSWAYHQGGSNGLPPAITEGNIEEGDVVAEVAVYRIDFNAMTPEIVHLISSSMTLTDAGTMALMASIQMIQKTTYSEVAYKPGDTDVLYFNPVCGEVYSNKKSLRFFVPLTRVPVGCSGVTITAGTYQAKANNAIIVSTANLASASKTVTLRHNGIEVVLTNNNGFAGSANAVCAVSGNMTIRFT